MVHCQCFACDRCLLDFYCIILHPFMACEAIIEFDEWNWWLFRISWQLTWRIGWKKWSLDEPLSPGNLRTSGDAFSVRWYCRDLFRLLWEKIFFLKNNFSSLCFHNFPYVFFFLQPPDFFSNRQVPPWLALQLGDPRWAGRYSAFSFSEAVCVNPCARETRDVARKHGMSILNIERPSALFLAASLRLGNDDLTVGG